MWRVGLMAALSLFASTTVFAAGPRLASPRLSAHDNESVTLSEPSQLSCTACTSPRHSPAAPAGGRQAAPLLCSIGEMPLGPTVPGCVTPPPLDLEAIPPL